MQMEHLFVLYTEVEKDVPFYLCSDFFVIFFDFDSNAMTDVADFAQNTIYNASTPWNVCQNQNISCHFHSYFFDKV